MTAQMLANRYELQRLLGHQSGRRTFLAKDVTTQSQVVIKLLSLDDGEWDDMKLLGREAETLRSLSHPAIPRYLEHFEATLPEGRQFAVVQSHLVGKSLESCLQEGRTFNEAELKAIARLLLEILAYLHDHNPPIIHRDIKPSNILLSTQAKSPSPLYLIGFGSVGGNAAPAESFTVVGTYGYMPPEQFVGRAIPASDLYSLGATLVALATRTHPSSLPHKGPRIEFESLVNLSQPLKDWLKRLIDPNLETRVSTAKAALHDLLQLQGAAGGGQKPAQKPNIPTKPANTKVLLSLNPDTLELGIPLPTANLRVWIDPQHVIVTAERQGLTLERPQVSPRPAISRLEWGAQQLNLCVGQQRYELGIGLTQPEIDWLTYELSQWLKLPVTRI